MENQVLSLSLDNIGFCPLTTETNTRGAPPTRAYNPYRVPNLYNHNISLSLSNLNTKITPMYVEVVMMKSKQSHIKY